MLRRSFSLASVVSLGGLVVWGGCSGSDDTNPSKPKVGQSDAGAPAEDASSQAPVDAAPATKPYEGTPITYGSCAAFAKCGGDIIGSWTVSGGCLSEETFAAARKTCPELKESNVVITATGKVDVTAEKVDRTMSIGFTGKLVLPKSCAFGQPCTLVAEFLKSGAATGGLKFEQVSCKESGTACDCDVGTKVSETISDTYTTTPEGELTTPSSGSPRTYDFCAQGEKLTFLETSKSQPLKLIVETKKN